MMVTGAITWPPMDGSMDWDGSTQEIDSSSSLCMMERCIGKRVVGMDDDWLTFPIPLFILKDLTVT